MRNRLTIALSGLALLVAAVPVLTGAEVDPEAVIRQAKAIVLSANPPEHGLTKVLADVLAASLVILPQADRSAEFKSRIEGAEKAFSQGKLAPDQAYRDLATAYELVSGGKAWQIPEALIGAGQGGLEQAAKVCAALLDSSLSAYKAGRRIEAARDLLGFVILVVTP